MLETIKKSLLAGLGAAVVTKEKIEKVTRKLAEEGKITTEEAETLSRDLIESGSRQWEDMQERVSNTVKKALEGLDMCTKQDFTALAGRVVALEKRIAALEEAEKPAEE
jgi:polyhydroxyalkanoate synthesis regulator phasin